MRRLSAASLIALAAFPVAAAGPEKKRPYPVVADETVVTATRRKTDPFKVPYTTDVLDGDDLRERVQPRSLPEALKGIAGVSAQKTAQGQGSPYFRGLTGYHTLFMIDGVRLNNATFRSGPNQYWNTVDPLALEKIEVVKGPSSVLYGSDAVGGTLNALTTRPWGGDGLHSRSYARYGSAEASLIGRQEFSWTEGAWGAVGGISFKDFGDMHGGRHYGTFPGTGYREEDGDLKLTRALSAGTHMTLAFSQVDQYDVPRTHTTADGISFRRTAVGTDIFRDLDQRRQLALLALETSEVEGIADTARFGLSWHNQGERQDRLPSNHREDIQSYRDSAYGLTAQFQKQSAAGLWTYGTEYYRDDVNSKGITYNADGTVRNHAIQGQVGDEAEYDLLGIYVQDEIGGDASPWSVIPGARYTWAKADADEVDVGGVATEVRDEWENVSGSLRGRYDLTDAVNLFGGVSQGFRAPNLSDLTRLDIARSGEQEVPSPGLEPEEFVQYEIGLKGRVENRLFGSVSYYHTDIHDFIDRVPTGNLVNGNREVVKRNTGDGSIDGVEATARAQLTEEWSAFGVFGWQVGAVDTFVTSDPASKERRPMSKMPPASATLGGRFAPPDEPFWVETLATMTRTQDRLSPADLLDNQRIPPQGTPGYTVYTLRIGRSIGRNVSVSAAVENVTDVDYRTHGSGTNEPGTNVILTADARF